MGRCKYKSKIFGLQCYLETTSEEDYCFWHLKIENKILTLEQINQLRRYDRETPLLDIYLSGVNLQEVDLTDAHLPGANLSESNLIGTKLNNAYMDYVNLTNADLKKSNLSHSRLINANLSNVNMQGANLDSVSFKDANLNNADLREAYLVNALFHKTSLVGTDFRKADLSLSRIIEVNLITANTQESKLKKSSIKKVNLINANFQGIDLSEANIQGENLSRANLRSANLTNANLQDSILVGANLQDANLTNANLRDSTLVSANLQGAKLARANLQGANLEEADLTEASLENTIFDSKSRLSKAKFINADVFQSYIDTTTTFRDAIFFKQKEDKNEKEFNEFCADHHYNKLITGAAKIENFEESKSFIKKELYEKSYEVYNKLYHFYSSSGDFEVAKHVHYRREEVYRKLLFERGGFQNKIKSLMFNWLILKQCAGYGDELRRPIINSIMEIIIFSILFLIIKGVSVSGRNVKLIDYFYLSVTTFTGLGFSNIQPDINVPIMQYLVMLEATLGVLNVALIIFIITYQVSR